MSLVVLFWVLVAVMVVGIAGILIPVLPGTGLILIAMVVWAIATQFANITWPLIAAFVVLLLGTGLELLALYWGVQRAGASSWSQIGAGVGLVLGILGLLPALPLGGPILGALIGPVIGAFVGEFLYRKELSTGDRLKQSLKASIAVVLGTVVGRAIELILASIAVAIFVFTVWPTIA
jgi:uncharacterized protein YqgC (DUF456 family)